ncbi:ATP-dependent DNA helicase-like protein II [Macroventuria anomochaeta]|uniref:ATP-dependent DNA helicase-like protein II n=1 Tax=Macroventuria anomochaeta TaxID=301207 RepID=A0ACB6S514_9PLEO|nr:ATP-dependent DNA helicase-like protein II [Macroventuria anomochaeta]KAF2628222.1 ATP-dependent DNA helicase-like protein II [Macroventuria anomochaeta]
MAGKEATVYILDLGAPMGKKRHGRDHTDLEWALEYVWDKITTTVATGRKTALMSVIGCRTDKSDLNGVMEEAEGYENITVFSELKQYLLSDIRRLQNKLKPSKTNEGDLISALAVAVQLMDSATQNKAGKPLKYDRRIIIVTDGRGEMDDGDLDDIAMKIKDTEAPIEIVLLGVDFDDPDYGYKEEDKDAAKANNEEVLKGFVEKCNGNFGTLAEAVEQLNIPRLKQPRPIPSFKGELTLGDPQKFDAALTIHVERYPCTMLAKPPTASSFVVRTDLGTSGLSDRSSATIVGEDHPMSDLAAVRHQRDYQIDDPEEPGTKKNVELEELEKGYEYGRTAVHIAESNLNVVKLETEPSLRIVGFAREEEFKRYLPMSRTNYIVPQRTNQMAQLGLSSFIHALHEGGLYAVARLVTKENKPPIMVLLSPRIEPDFECLIDVELPFEEDMRRYKFPPLDRKLTVSGKVITEHKDLPNADLTAAMGAYVDAMDLSTFSKDEDGNPDEYAKPEDTYAPLVHRINHIIRWRATHSDPTLTIPDPPEILMKYSNPPSDLVERANSILESLKVASDVKKVPPKVKGRGKRNRSEREKPISGLDIDALLGNPTQVKIDPANLVPSFKQALAVTDDLAAIQSAADAMAKEIRNLVKNSVGESAYGRALEAVRVMRDELTELEEPEMYNNFVREFKKELLEDALNGDRREMWWRVRGSKYGLIDQKRSLVSDVTEKEADDFYKT